VVDARGRVKRFSEGDWRVEYAEYASVGDVELPRRLSVSARPGAGWGDGGRSRHPRSPRLTMRGGDESGGGDVAGDGGVAGDGEQLSVRLVVTRWRGLDFADAGD